MSGRSDEEESGIRIQKVLAGAGIASRRAAEDLIRQGRVMVNGRLAGLGMRVDPGRDHVAVDGSRVPVDPAKRYVLLNKPVGVITTSKDPAGRPTVLELIDVGVRVFSVGRLDADTEGVLLLTNDGDLAHRLAHPSYGVEKVYLAEVRGRLSRREGAILTNEGVSIDAGRKAKATRVRIRDTRGSSGRDATLVEIGIHEGRKHVVRKMLEGLGFPVKRLTRIKFGPLGLRGLKPGGYRELTPTEVASLYQTVGL